MRDECRAAAITVFFLVHHEIQMKSEQRNGCSFFTSALSFVAVGNSEHPRLFEKLRATKKFSVNFNILLSFKITRK